SDLLPADATDALLPLILCEKTCIRFVALTCIW
ncbi:hypothetical protein A2U01_0103342, partial [Trifolium medium]|nr:hypothetical protein [Trifolium medium]